MTTLHVAQLSYQFKHGRGTAYRKRIEHTCGNLLCVNPEHLTLLSTRPRSSRNGRVRTPPQQELVLSRREHEGGPEEQETGLEQEEGEAEELILPTQAPPQDISRVQTIREQVQALTQVLMSGLPLLIGVHHPTSPRVDRRYYFPVLSVKAREDSLVIAYIDPYDELILTKVLPQDLCLIVGKHVE